MTAVWIVMVIFGSLVLILGTLCGTILVAMKLRHGGLSARSREAQGEEARMIQEIYQGLSRMETRVEALETILMERKEKCHDDHEKKAL
jgi:phage shock protein B